MATVVLKGASLLLVSFCAFTVLLPSVAQGYDDCANLFFTAGWQKCFFNKFRSNWVFNSNPLEDDDDGDNMSSDQSFQFNFPAMPSIPNIDNLIQQAQAQAGQGGSSSSFSSSQFASGGSGSSKSVMSTNGRTWTVESNGLSTMSSDDGNVRTVEISIGEPESLNNSYGDDNSLTVTLTYSDGTQRWVKVKLDSPVLARDLKIERQNGQLRIVGQV